MNNVNNAPHAERRCRIMRKDYGKRYRQTTNPFWKYSRRGGSPRLLRHE